MNKQELMENYTMEQLAEMVVKFKSEGKIKNPEIRINCPVCGTSFEFFDGKERFYITVLTDAMHLLEDENKNLKYQIEHKQTDINQINDILKEFFGVTFEICQTEEDFEGFKKCLRNTIKSSCATDFIPAEPIKVADMLINEVVEYEHSPLTKSFLGEKGTRNLFDLSELRQIAEHLLIYCNANSEE